jgi:hypothetical protein
MTDGLSARMTPRDFENGYWYLDQRQFADRIGIPAAKKLRKDELEKAIVAFLRTGTGALPAVSGMRTFFERPDEKPGSNECGRSNQ